MAIFVFVAARSLFCLNPFSMPVKNHKDVYVGGFLLITFKKNVL